VAFAGALNIRFIDDAQDARINGDFGGLETLLLTRQNPARATALA
jgi:hypothetical protein